MNDHDQRRRPRPIGWTGGPPAHAPGEWDYRRRSRAGRRASRRKRSSRLWKLVLLVAVLAGIATVGVGAVTTIVSSNGFGLFRCTLGAPMAIEGARTSFLVGAGGTPLGAVPAVRDREPVPLKEISPWAVKATIAIEDRRFWDHGALDYAGIARAALADIKSGRVVEGGSTLSQQLARRLYIPEPSPTLGRKVTEACLAIRLERAWGKRGILANYLNHVFYGANAYGIEAASRTYFSRPAKQLSIAQAALLAGLPQAPSVYDPRRSRAAALARRDEVLKAMLDNGDITEAQYRRATHSRLGLRLGRRYKLIRAREFFSFAQRQLERRYGRTVVHRGGIRVQTTVDLRLEGLARQAMAAHLPGAEDPAAALVAIDPRTGAIRAMATRAPGGRLDYNLAYQAHRQTGSAAKVFTLTAAVAGGMSLESTWNGPSALTITDPRCLDQGYKPWVVHNYSDEESGTFTLAQATANSVNTIYAQIVTQVGPANVVAMAHRLGIRTDIQPVCSVTLGSQAVTPLEMTNVFATLAAGGVRHDPSAVAMVRQPSGHVLQRLSAKGSRVISAGVAGLVTQALEGVVQGGTGTAAAIDRPVAGKTGTAEKFVDAWFCGFAPQLATCVWVGYPRGEIPLENVEGWPQVFGGSIPAEIWHDFMLGALAGQPVQGLPGWDAPPAY